MQETKYYLSEEEQDNFFCNSNIIINGILYDNETVFLDKEAMELMEKIEKIHKKIAAYKAKKNEIYIQLIKVLSREEIATLFYSQQNPIRCFIFKMEAN